MNDNAHPNYGVLAYDDVTPYITEAGTMRRLYQHAPCEICGTRNWTYRPVQDQDCPHCRRGRVARNEDDQLMLLGE